MRLTMHTDYALRMLMSLAIRDGSMTVQEIAGQYGVSRNHLLKVALRLKNLGYIRSCRGRAGGVALALVPDDVNIGEVVRAMEDGFGLVDCLKQNGGNCLLSPACRLKSVVHEALEAFLGVFDGYTLADLVADRSALAQLFDRVPAHRPVAVA